MPKTNNETTKEYKKRVIDIKSESFCAAKWYNSTIWLGSGQTTSCHHPLPHAIDLEEIKINPSAIHNTKQKKAERKMMQEGERPSGCDYCWKVEDSDSDTISDRVYKTIIYDDKELDDAYNKPHTEDVNLKTLEISFDRTCQFACSYCNPAFSSTWAKDIRKNGPYIQLVSDGRNHFTHEHSGSQRYTINEHNPYAEAFFKWWETDLHKTLDELRITGGEPLMSGYTWRLIDWFNENKGQSKTRLAINSNLGFNKDVLDRLLTSTEGIELDIYTSNEAYSEAAEYIRDGLNWKQWLDNVHYLLESRKIRSLHIMCTINALSLTSLPDFLLAVTALKEQYSRDKVSFTLNILRFPSFQSPLVLSDELRTQFQTDLNKFQSTVMKKNEYDYSQNKAHRLFHSHEIEHIQRLASYLDVKNNPSESVSQAVLQRDFKNFYQQYDQRRGKDFKYTFPQLAKWYEGL